MSLQQIVAKVASLGGLNVNSPEQMLFEIAAINVAAKEIYDKYDLIGSLWAQYVRIESTEGMTISLPYYVGCIRAVRLAYSNMDVGTVDIRPRFQSRSWQLENMLAWQLKGESPIKKDIENEGLITVTFTKPCEKAINVTISGETTDSAEDREVLSFVTGDLSKTTVKAFKTVTPTKDVTCLYNATIYDMNGEELATIPNNQLRSLYLRAGIMNPASAFYSVTIPSFQFYEVLWKYRFKPFVNLTDEFLCPGYDDAIFWKRMEHEYRSKQTSSPEELAAFTAKANDCFGKCAEIITLLANNVDQNIDKIMNFKSNPIYDTFASLGRGYWPNSLGGGYCGGWRGP